MRGHTSICGAFATKSECHDLYTLVVVEIDRAPRTIPPGLLAGR
jgi:hypothetical protein